jgi:uracil-DNA glycosylase
MEKQWLIQTFTQNWYNRLNHYLETKEFEQLGNKIGVARKTTPIYPKSSEVFRCFTETPFGEVKVVILGNEPYNNAYADGLAFSCSGAEGLPRKKLQSSLVTIYETVERTVYRGLYLDKDPSLERWAKQGVLLLNASLTSTDEKEKHVSLWKPFTIEVLKALSEYNTGIIYCLWGNKAKEFKKYINPKFNYILEDCHPSSANFNQMIWECNHFVEINKILKQNNNLEIIW